ncbi:MAG: very short patch repair endonuclease [Candidatus Dormibacterales bacterium]
MDLCDAAEDLIRREAVPGWLTAEQRSWNMAAIRSSGTSPEARLLAAVKLAVPRRKIGERLPELPGKPDFYLAGLRPAIFADGCFWHGCPDHGRTPDDNRSYWEPKLARNRVRDREANAVKWDRRSSRGEHLPARL